MTIININEDYINFIRSKKHLNIKDIMILESIRYRYSKEYSSPVISGHNMIFRWIDDVLYQIK